MRNIQHGELQSEFWSKVIATKCLTCHRKGGDAEASRLVFVDPDRSDATLRGQAIGQFDSHANNDADQMKLIPEFLAGIAYILRRAAELQIRDRLVVIVQSEMGRTPTYNSGNGKDHWSIGSALFFGSGIQGDRVIGATDAQQFAVPIDPKTLVADNEKGIRLRPEHVHQALRELADIAAHPFSQKFPLAVDAGEKLHGIWG